MTNPQGGSTVVNLYKKENSLLENILLKVTGYENSHFTYYQRR